MKPTILLTGKQGQVGRELSWTLGEIGNVIAFDRAQLDLSNPGKIREVVRAVSPQWIVNAAAYTAVDKAESEEASARAINAEAPALLAEEAKKVGAALIHFSTDYVFDGTKRAPYTEEDPPNPQNAYGRTKLAGEEAIRSSGVAHLIFRTGWVYGRHGKNFLLTILRLAAEQGDLKIVDDQIGSPTWCREIAIGASKVLAQFLKDGDPGAIAHAGGTYHLTASGETSWFHFAEAILEEASRMKAPTAWFLAATKGKPIIARGVLPITTQQYTTPARRPSYSVLSNERFTRTFGISLPDWGSQLREVFAGDGS
jgi:dTDP-4-dehydrorhamnose reductase